VKKLIKFKENIFSEINLKLQKSKHSKVIFFCKTSLQI
jgi:hypothetical protein